MASNRVPIRLLGSTSHPAATNDLGWCADCWRIARVTINSPSIAWPLRYRGHMVMATGRYRTTLQEPELARAIYAGVVEMIHAVSWYHADVIFRDFVSELWSKRKFALDRGDIIEADCMKLMLNGVPGKFGQRQIRWVDDPTLYASQPWGTGHIIDSRTGEVSNVRYLNWRVQRQRKFGELIPTADPAEIAEVLRVGEPENIGPAYSDESKHSLPQIAGAITSWGRVILEETRQCAGAENVYYTDTDCLHTNRVGYERLLARGYVTSGEIGRCDLKCTASTAEYRGIKYYSIDGCWTCSGHKDNATPILDDKWTQEEFTGLQGLLSHGADSHLESHLVQCDRSNEFIPGSVSATGRVSPICITDETLAQ